LQVLSLVLASATAPASTVFLDGLDLSAMTRGWGDVRANRSVEGNPVTIGGRAFDRGIGTHAKSVWTVDLNGPATRVTAWVGIDDEKQGCGSAAFRVKTDGRLLFDSGVMRPGEAAKRVDVDVKGARRLRLEVTDGGDGIDCDHADWAEAAITYAGEGHPGPAEPANDPPPPIGLSNEAEPRINGPRVVGTTPGRPFVFLVPATGEGPFAFSASGLPPGLVLDAKTGVVSGSVKKAGTHKVTVTVTGPKGTATRELRIVAGKGKLALTPPLGWNSWNVWGCAVDQDKVKAAADWLVRSGLAAHGFAYINIDDCWEAGRAPDGTILTNEKFPDMKGLADYVHGLGLKLGIYSGPGPKTCGGFTASWKHEAQDAKTYADWGIDYLKYDWCSYGDVATGEGREKAVRPYRVMRQGLDASGRDIVFSFCQYGMDKVWEWGEKTGGNLWRTTGDIGDNWWSLSGITFGQPELSKWAGPGHWNDPDMLVVGQVGWGPELHPTKLTPNEQILHITAWSLLAAPLLIGCDLAQLDEFTLALLTNDEVLDVNQDALGAAATRRAGTEDWEVWARPLADGTTAVGLFNKGYDRMEISATWKDLGLKGKLPVRDCWLRKDLGEFAGSFAASVPTHGAMLLRVGKPRGKE
jgi:alpha-galactosidase